MKGIRVPREDCTFVADLISNPSLFPTMQLLRFKSVFIKSLGSLHISKNFTLTYLTEYLLVTHLRLAYTSPTASTASWPFSL